MHERHGDTRLVQWTMGVCPQAVPHGSSGLCIRTLWDEQAEKGVGTLCNSVARVECGARTWGGEVPPGLELREMGYLSGTRLISPDRSVQGEGGLLSSRKGIIPCQVLNPVMEGREVSPIPFRDCIGHPSSRPRCCDTQPEDTQSRLLKLLRVSVCLCV